MSYDIKLTAGGVDVDAGKVVVSILIPSDLKGVKFDIYHVHDGEATPVEYVIDGDYAIFTVEDFSEFVFVKTEVGKTAFIAALGVVAILSLLILVIGRRH